VHRTRSTIRFRRGMTLVELLVVVSIVVILFATAIPIMRPALKDRKLREGSRQINTFIINAKARAAESGRPHGIWIVRNNDNPDLRDSSYQIFIAETPIPFAGDTLNANCTLGDTDNDGFVDAVEFTDTYDVVKTGDLIQIDYKGPKYILTITQPGATKRVSLMVPPLAGYSLPRMRASGLAPFQVFRQPIRSSIPPLELPNGIVIDLGWSGVGFEGQEMANAVAGMNDIVIMFAPTGGVDRVYGFSTPIPGTIHLLVGRVEQVTQLAESGATTNILDGTASWVSIGHLTGTVTTSENYADGNIAASNAAGIRTARTIAQQKQTMGGR
jgi:prepilin-type N-terminal cleavage/methylation domain-containing protein